MKTGAYCFGFLVGLCNTLDFTAPSLLDITHSVHELPSAGQIPRRFVACVDSSPSITSYDSILLREKRQSEMQRRSGNVDMSSQHFSQ